MITKVQFSSDELELLRSYACDLYKDCPIASHAQLLAKISVLTVETRQHEIDEELCRVFES